MSHRPIPVPSQPPRHHSLFPYELLAAMLAGTGLLLGLKLAGTITWSWWAVFAPLWAPAAVAAFVIAIVLVIVIGGDLADRGQV